MIVASDYFISHVIFFEQNCKSKDIHKYTVSKARAWHCFNAISNWFFLSRAWRRDTLWIMTFSASIHTRKSKIHSKSCWTRTGFELLAPCYHIQYVSCLTCSWWRWRRVRSDRSSLLLPWSDNTWRKLTFHWRISDFSPRWNDLSSFFNPLIKFFTEWK